jgi:hypothetical protein
MVAVAPPDAQPAARRERTEQAARAWRWVEHTTVGLALLWWAWPLTARTGGRGAGALAIGCATVLAAMAAQRPWRRVPSAMAATAVAVSLAALLVCELTPVGFARADSAVNYVYSVGLAVTAWCYARSPRRRELLLAALLFAGMREFAGAFFAWWGHGTSNVPMNGDFPWRNSYAAFLIGPAVLGVAAAARARGPLRLLGWVAAPMCAAGVVFSTSRAAMAMVVAGWVAVGCYVLRAPSRARLARWVAVSALSLGFVFALAGPPFFPHRVSPFAATDQRAAHGETLAANGHYRVEFWQEAIAAFQSRPAAGTGYQEMAAVSYGRKPADWARAPLAHNSYLQPLADGGLLLGVPFLLACAAIAIGLVFVALMRFVRRPRDDLRDGDDPVLAGVAAAAGLLLMAHAAIDFDWTQPSNLAMFGLVAAVAFAARRRGVPARVPSRVLATSLLVLVAISAYTAHHWDGVNDLRTEHITAASAGDFVDAGHGPLHDYRPAVQVLSAYDDGLALDDAVVRKALARTAGIAQEDRGIALLRADVLARLGDRSQAVQEVDVALASLHDAAPSFWTPAGRALLTAGQSARGHALLSQAADFAAEHNLAPVYWAAVQALLTSDGQPLSRADACAVSAGIDRFGPPPALPAFSGLGTVRGCPALPAPAE